MVERGVLHKLDREVQINLPLAQMRPPRPSYNRGLAGSSWEARETDVASALQGGLGDCWFLSAIAALSEEPKRVRSLFLNNQAHDDGGFRIKFYKSGR